MSNKDFKEGVERNSAPPSELASRKDLFWHGIIVMSWATSDIREVCFRYLRPFAYCTFAY
jgi:hypothetical protein